MHDPFQEEHPIVSEKVEINSFFTDLEILRKKYDSKNYNYDLEMNSINLIFEFAKRIQAQKAKTYQGSWKKRGWQVSIFGNISRKFDRLESIFMDPTKVLDFIINAKENNDEEPVVDTLIDMGVYCFLAASELMLTKPAIFDGWLKRNGLKKS